jgi:hypothetical protein
VLNYKVPNFGKDSDIITTNKNIAETEKELGHTMKASFAQPAGPADYKVPSFGLDRDVQATLAHISSVEKKLKVKYDPERKKGPPGPDAVDYKVANFGVDSDILTTRNSLSIAEKTRGKRLSMVQAADETFKNAIPDYENALDVQIGESSDPICSSSGCTQYTHKKTPRGYPIDYPVADHGPDPTIAGTANSIKVAEEMHSHKLVMGTPESKAKYHNVAKDTNYDFAPKLDKDVEDT